MPWHSVENVFYIFGCQWFETILVSTNSCYYISYLTIWNQWLSLLDKKYMSYYWFVQIWAAFHPESGISQEWDKCHQLRNVINQLNKAAKLMFIPGKEMSFNEGGIPSKSNYNPVRQYNNSKLVQYRMDFLFLLMQPVVINSFTTLMFIREKANKNW